MFGITSAKLEVGMTIDKINNSNASKNVKKKQIELFNKYNTTPDDKIDEKEFAQYEKDCTRQKWITAGFAIGGAALAGGLLYLGYKNLSGNNFQEKWQNIKNLITKTKEATQTPVAPVIEENFEAQLKNIRSFQDLEHIIKNASSEECELIIKRLNDPNVRRYNGYRVDKYVTMAEERAKQLLGTQTAQIEHNAVAMVGNKATVVRADLVQENPTFTPHISSAAPKVDAAALAKGVEGPVLSASYASKAENLPIQEVRTQSYYDEIMDDIAKSGGEKSFFNPRTGNTIKVGVSYTGFPDRVTVSRGDIEFLKLMESGEGYSRTSRYVADGQNILTRNNSSRDLLRTSVTGKTSWQAQSGKDYWIGAPASRTPVGSKIHVERITSAGQKVIIANSATPNKVIVTFFEDEAPSRPFKITPEELFEKFGVKI